MTLKAGQIILAGPFPRSVDASAGDTFHADDRPLGEVAFRFRP